MNAAMGELTVVEAEHKNSLLFIALLKALGRTTRRRGGFT